jgi:TolB-like protein
MKHRCATSVLVTLLCLIPVITAATSEAAAANPQDKVRLAIFPFTSKNLERTKTDEFRNQLSKSLAQTERFTVMSDAAMQTHLNDLGLPDLEECQTPSCLATIGKQLAVQQVLHGTIEQRDSSITLVVRLVDTDTGRLLFSRTVEQVTEEGIFSIAQSLAATTIEREGGWRWYYVAGAVLVASATIYLLSKGLGGDQGRQIEQPPTPPPPIGN